MKLSEFITLAEATRSATAKRLGIMNEPNAEQIRNMRILATKIFDPCRRFVGGPLAASSFFRHPSVNKAIGGSTTSDHTSGEAIDITTRWYKVAKTNADVFHFIKDNLVFDQLIWEFGTDEDPDWIHVGLRTNRPNRGVILKAVRVNGQIKYIPYA